MSVFYAVTKFTFQMIRWIMGLNPVAGMIVFMLPPYVKSTTNRPSVQVETMKNTATMWADSEGCLMGIP
jgi:hypothetical protein